MRVALCGLVALATAFAAENHEMSRTLADENAKLRKEIQGLQTQIAEFRAIQEKRAKLSSMSASSPATLLQNDRAKFGRGTKASRPTFAQPLTRLAA